MPPEAAPVVVAEDPDLEELLHPATKTTAAANMIGIPHLLWTIFPNPLVDFLYRNDSWAHDTRGPRPYTSRFASEIWFSLAKWLSSNLDWWAAVTADSNSTEWARISLFDPLPGSCCRNRTCPRSRCIEEALL